MDSEEEQQLTAVAMSYRVPYIGDDDEKLWKHISEAELDTGGKARANVCEVIQSSGTGKSRTVNELGKKCVLIDVCIRSGGSGYPPPDREIRDFLAVEDWHRKGAQRRCFAALIGLFQHTLVTLKLAKDTGEASSEEELIQWFHERMSWSIGSRQPTREYREQFFAQVTSIARKHYERSSSKDGHSLTGELRGHVEKLVEFLDDASGPGGKQKAKKVVVAFDEAHVLSRYEGTVRYGDGSEKPWTNLTVLSEAFGSVSSSPIFCLLLSTSPKPKLASLNPVPPFTALTFDLFAPRLTWADDYLIRGSPEEDEDSDPPEESEEAAEGQPDDCLTLNEITKTGFLAHFGRPMFALKHNLGSSMTRRTTQAFALQKLICNNPSSLVDRKTHKLNLTDSIAIACLSQRLCVDFDAASYYEVEETQIEQHMRLCHEIGPEHQYLESSPGSEPLLAEAAALIMMHNDFRPAEMLKTVFDCRGIKKVSRGEIIGMLAATLARDAIVRENMTQWSEKHGYRSSDLLSGEVREGTEEGDREGPGFRSAGVVPFLKKLFLIQDEDEAKLNQDGRLSDAYLYFNHFVKPIEEGTCVLECLMGFMTRGAAPFYADGMLPAVDFVLPVLFGETLRCPSMSFVLVYVNNDPSITFEGNQQDFFATMNMVVHRLFAESEDPKPVVRIVFSLRSEKKLHYEWKELVVRGQRYQALDIWCGGLSFYRKPIQHSKKASAEVRERREMQEEKEWRALVRSTMSIFHRILEDEGDEFFEKSMLPGGADDVSHWGWIQNFPPSRSKLSE